MTDKDRIENAIRHIQTATDVDPWAMEIAVEAMKKQIPMKPTETTGKTLGIAVKQAVCPVCNYYFPHVEFLGNFSGGRRITYCDTCGQAIDWDGWEFDE
jgi:hypothetical protein